MRSAQAAEAKHENKDLLALTQVIAALRGRGHVPFRASAPTSMMEAELQGGGRAVMLACVSPAVPRSATRSTLYYAAQAQEARTRQRELSVAARAAPRPHQPTVPSSAARLASAAPAARASAPARAGLGSEAGRPNAVLRTITPPKKVFHKCNPRTFFKLTAEDSKLPTEEVSFCLDNFFDLTLSFGKQSDTAQDSAIDHLEGVFFL